MLNSVSVVSCFSRGSFLALKISFFRVEVLTSFVGCDEWSVVSVGCLCVRCVTILHSGRPSWSTWHVMSGVVLVCVCCVSGVSVGSYKKMSGNHGRLLRRINHSHKSAQIPGFHFVTAVDGLPIHKFEKILHQTSSFWK